MATDGATVAPLAGQTLAITGRCASMTQRELSQLIVELGGQLVARPTRKTSLLVVGALGWPLHEDGRPTQNLERARQLRSSGYPLEIVPEEQFLERLGLWQQQQAIRGEYTLGQLSRILDVSIDRLRVWMRAGLIEPVRVEHRLAYFDFLQVSSAKTLWELVQSGVSPARLRASFEQLRRWLPDVDQPLGQLTLLEDRGRLLIRLDGGLLAEPSGQLQLDFDGRGEHLGRAVDLPPRSADDWFEEAVALEQLGRFAEAAEAYAEAIVSEPEDPVLHFNAGNAQYAAGRVSEAVAYFERAVQLDGAYVEAWNNLGVALGELGRGDDGVRSIRRALEIVPTYADAHYNLAETLHELGRSDEAAEHWGAYLKLDGRSRWAGGVRRQLESNEEE